MSKYTLIQIQGNQQTDTGLSGKTVVQAQARTIYRLRDETGAQPHKLALWRRGQDLVLEVQGAVVTTLQGFYATGQDAAQAPHYLLDTGVPGDPWIVTGRAPQQKISAAEDLVWRLDDDVVNVQLSPEQLRQVWAQSEVQQNLGDKRYTGDDSSRREIQDLLDRWKPGATSATKAAAASKVVVDEIGDLLITGTVSAGPVFGGVTLQAWSSTGQLLGTTTIQADGSWTISAPQMGNYRGSVLLKVIDANGVSVNYSDEVTAASKSLNTELRAIGVAQEGQTLFTVSGLDAHLIIHITPLTELAVRQAGVTGNQAPSVDAALQANANVAQAFGLSGVNLTGPVTTTNSADFSGVDGLTSAEKYGIALAKLSGLDALNGGSVATTLDILASNLQGNSLTSTGARVLDQGRAQALAALKASDSTFNAGNGDTDHDTLLNRQLLGDIVVTAQSLTSDGKLAITGTALPGSTVTVTLPDGSTQTAVADASGHFSLTTANAQPALDKPLQLTGSDALAAPVQSAAPKAPIIEQSNGRLISGVGEPGTTVEVLTADGTSLGTAQVDELGNWTLIPANAVPVGTALRATATDADGNASGPGAGTSADALITTIPEASDAYVNAQEKSSGGGVPVLVSLPASAAAGDTITTVLKRPDGSSVTLSTVLTAQDVAAGQLTQLAPQADLSTDGLYQTTTTLTNASGTSAPSVRQFLLDTAAPAAPVIAPSNGQVVNGTAEPGTLVEVRDGAGNLIGTVGPVGPDGNWTLVPARPLPDDTPLTATATDLAGNTSPVGNGIVDVGALLITGAVDNVGPNTGLLFDGAVTNDTSPQLAGSLGAPLTSGQTLAIWRQLDDGAFEFIGNAVVNGTSWTLQDGDLADGSYTYQARVMNGSTLVQSSGDFNLTVVTAAPAAPNTTVPEAGTDHLVNAAEKASDGGVPVVTQLPDNARVGDVVTTTVTLADGTQLTLSTTLKMADLQAGRISQLIPADKLGTDGEYPVSSTWTSSVTGLTSAPTDSTFVLDTTPPAAPAADVAATSDTGASNTDNITQDNTPTISGSGTNGDTITVTLPTGEVLTTTVVGGVWSVTPTQALPDGANQSVLVTATDPAGNTSAPTTVPVTIDTQGPSAPAVQIPEASQGINLAEKNSDGGVPLVVTVPADARVGDVVTTVVTKPDGC